MKPETVAVMKLVQEIHDVEEDIRQLEERKGRLEYRLDQMIAPRINAINVPVGDIAIVRRGRSDSEESGAGKMRSLLNENPSLVWSADDVSTRLAIPISTVRTTLSKMVKKGTIEKRGFNGYGAISTKEKETTSEEIVS